jgi:hypothetical protein
VHLQSQARPRGPMKLLQFGRNSYGENSSHSFINSYALPICLDAFLKHA